MLGLLLFLAAGRQDGVTWHMQAIQTPHSACRQASRASDVYAFGIMLWEAGGGRPYEGVRRSQVGAQHRQPLGAPCAAGIGPVGASPRMSSGAPWRPGLTRLRHWLHS
jgi:hypothetical protein